VQTYKYPLVITAGCSLCWQVSKKVEGKCVGKEEGNPRIEITLRRMDGMHFHFIFTFYTKRESLYGFEHILSIVSQEGCKVIRSNGASIKRALYGN
jgi:hypothetical protein